MSALPGRPSYEDRRRHGTRPDLWPTFREPREPERLPLHDFAAAFVDSIRGLFLRPALRPAQPGDYGLAR